MQTFIEWFVKNSVAANLLMLLLVVGGLFAIPGLKKEIFPELDSEFVSVSVVYPGSSPQEVEEGICTKIEEEIRT